MTRRKRQKQIKQNTAILGVIFAFFIGVFAGLVLSEALRSPPPKKQLTKEEKFIQRCKNPQTPLSSLEKIDCSIHVLGKGIKKIK